MVKKECFNCDQTGTIETTKNYIKKKCFVCRGQGEIKNNVFLKTEDITTKEINYYDDSNIDSLFTKRSHTEGYCEYMIGYDDICEQPLERLHVELGLKTLSKCCFRQLKMSIIKKGE